MALSTSTRRRVGLLTHRPASGAGADLAAGLLRAGLCARDYTAWPGPEQHTGHELSKHAQQALRTPLRYLGALGHAVIRGQGPAFRAAVDIAAQGRRDGITHLHACDESSADAAAWAAGFLGVGFSFWLPARLAPPAQAALLSRRLRTASFAFGTSNSDVHAAQALVPGAVLHRVYPGVDHRHFSPRLRRPTARVPLVLAVAGDGEDVEHVVEACRRLVEQGVDLRCDIVCDRDAAARAQGRVEQQQLQHAVRILGPVSASRLEDRLARAALYLQTPRHEDARLVAGGMPPELLQAMAIGLPVLAQRSPLLEECVRHGESGWLFAGFDAEALADALHHLLSTPRLGEQLGKQARRRALECFDAEVNLRSAKAWLEQTACREEVRGRRGGLTWHRAEEVHHA